MVGGIEEVDPVEEESRLIDCKSLLTDSSVAASEVDRRLSSN